MRVGKRTGLVIIVCALLASSLYVLTWDWLRNRSSLCYLAARSELASERAVRSEGVLYASARAPVMLNGGECGLRSDAWAIIEVDPNARFDCDTKTVLDGLTVEVPDGATMRVRAIVTGCLEDLGHPCFAPRFRIRASKIEATSKIELVRFDAILDATP
jgi:hypothetical protein